MQCVGYDVDFQRNLAEKFPGWIPKSKPKKNTGSHKSKAAPLSNSKSMGRKRKRLVEESSDSEGEVNDESKEDEDEPVYLSKGTHSRPA